MRLWMELADTADSKSAARNGVGVRVPPDAPILHESASGKLAVCKTAIAGPIPASCSKLVVQTFATGCECWDAQATRLLARNFRPHLDTVPWKMRDAQAYGLG